jgi:hypothetical protein
MFRKMLVTAAAVLGFAAFGPMPQVDAADVTLHEVTENMQMKKFKAAGYRRQATSALTGTAAPGTALCPLTVPCVINAIGSDDIDVTTGLGTFKGTWTSVVPGDNDVDAPEYQIGTGSFRGVMDFSPALVHSVPYGTVVGEFTVGSAKYPFTGVFYLPFAMPGDPTRTPLYLDLSAGDAVLVAPNEFSLGYPTVKFDIDFGHRR